MTNSIGDPVFDNSEEGSQFWKYSRIGEESREEINKSRQFPSEEFLAMGYKKTDPVLMELIENNLSKLLTSNPRYSESLVPKETGKTFNLQHFSNFYEELCKEAGYGSKLPVDKVEPSRSEEKLLNYLNERFFQVLKPSDSKHNSPYYTFADVTSKDGTVKYCCIEGLTLIFLGNILAGFKVSKYMGPKKSRKKKDSEEDEVEDSYKDDSLVNWWKTHKNRRVAQSIEFIPSEKPGFVELKNRGTIFNVWGGHPYYCSYTFPTLKDLGPLPDSDRCPTSWEAACEIRAHREDMILIMTAIWNHIYYILCNGNIDHTKYVLSWLAKVYQRPWEKTDVAIVVVGEQGTGKTSFEEMLAKIFGMNGTFVSASKDLFRQFSGHLFVNKVFVALDEITVKNFEDCNSLKNIITSNEVRAEKKCQDATQKHNFINLFTSTNDKHPILMDKGNNRRYCMLEASEEKLLDTEYWRVWFKYIVNNPIAFAVLSRFLTLYDWEQVDLRQVPQTELLQRQVIHALDVVDNWWLTIIREAKHVAFSWGDIVEVDPKSPLWVISQVKLKDLYDKFQIDTNNRNKMPYAQWLDNFQQLLPLDETLDGLTVAVEVPLLESCRTHIQQLYPTALDKISNSSNNRREVRKRKLSQKQTQSELLAAKLPKIDSFFK